MRSLPLHISGILFCFLSAGCSQQPVVTAVGETRIQATASGPRAIAAIANESRYRADIAAAIKAQRLYSPAGNNAFELYLASRAARPDDPSIQAALLELEPYLVIAAEQSLHRGEIAEARRLIGMLAKADGQAGALPRLREQLAAAL